MTPAPTLAWHFVGSTLRDGRPVPADGELLAHRGDLVLCESGIHASHRILDALGCALGDTLCRVECGGTIVSHRDGTIIASERTILWRINAVPVLRQFARECALDVAHLWKAPSHVLEYLRTGDEALRNSAEDTAMAAEWGNAQVAALRNAARVTSWVATWPAVRDIGGSAAWDATDAAAAARAAAWDNGGAAAWSAAGAAQEARLVALVEAAHAAAHPSAGGVMVEDAAPTT